MHDHWLTRLHECALQRQPRSVAQYSTVLQEVVPADSPKQNLTGGNEWRILYFAKSCSEVLIATFQSAFQLMAAAKAYAKETIVSLWTNDGMRTVADLDDGLDLTAERLRPATAGLVESDQAMQMKNALFMLRGEMVAMRKMAEKGRKSVEIRMRFRGFEKFSEFRKFQSVRNFSKMSPAELRHWLFIYEFLNVPDNETLALNGQLRHFLELGEAIFAEAEANSSEMHSLEFLRDKKESLFHAIAFARKWNDARKEPKLGKQSPELRSPLFAAINFLSEGMEHNFSRAFPAQVVQGAAVKQQAILNPHPASSSQYPPADKAWPAS